MSASERVARKIELLAIHEAEMKRLQRRWATLQKRKMKLLRPVKRGVK